MKNKSVSPPAADAVPSALWKMSGRHAVAYVQDAEVACALLNTDAKNVAKQAMAVYYDGKGKVMAYQVRFSTDQWDSVQQRLGAGVLVLAAPPAAVPAKPKATPTRSPSSARSKSSESPWQGRAERPGRAPSPPTASKRTTAPPPRKPAG